MEYPNDFMIKGMTPDKCVDINRKEGELHHDADHPHDTARSGAYTGVKKTPPTQSAVQGDRTDQGGPGTGNPGQIPINHITPFPKNYLSPLGLDSQSLLNLNKTQGTGTANVFYKDAAKASNPFSDLAAMDRSMYRGACVQVEGTCKVFHGFQEASTLHGLVTNNLSMVNRIADLEAVINTMIKKNTDHEHGIDLMQGDGGPDSPHVHTGDHQADHTDEDHDHEPPDSPPEEEASDNEEVDDGPTSGHHAGHPPPPDGHTHPNSLTGAEHDHEPAHSH